MSGQEWLHEAGALVEAHFRGRAAPPELVEMAKQDPMRALEVLIRGMLEMLIAGEIPLAELTQVFVGWLLG